MWYIVIFICCILKLQFCKKVSKLFAHCKFFLSLLKCGFHSLLCSLDLSNSLVVTLLPTFHSFCYFDARGFLQISNYRLNFQDELICAPLQRLQADWYMEYIEVWKNIAIMLFPYVLYTKRIVCDGKLARIWLTGKKSWCWGTDSEYVNP